MLVAESDLEGDSGGRSDTSGQKKEEAKPKKGNVLAKLKKKKKEKEDGDGGNEKTGKGKKNDGTRSEPQTPVGAPPAIRFSIPALPKRSQSMKPRPRTQPSIDSTASTADSTKSIANSSLTKASRESVRADDSPVPTVGDSPTEEIRYIIAPKSDGTMRGRKNGIPIPEIGITFPTERTERSRSTDRTRGLSPGRSASPWTDRQDTSSRLVADVRVLERNLGKGALLDDFGK